MSVALTFTAPPPGLDPLVNFTLRSVPGAEGLYKLEANDNVDKRMFLLDAAVYLPAYHPVLSDGQAQSLGLVSANDAQVLVVANPGNGATTVNLLAPIVVNTATGSGAQCILEGQDWPLRAELGAARA
jgi:flagellar assembly factor FliW